MVTESGTEYADNRLFESTGCDGANYYYQDRQAEEEYQVRPFVSSGSGLRPISVTQVPRSSPPIGEDCFAYAYGCQASKFLRNLPSTPFMSSQEWISTSHDISVALSYTIPFPRVPTYYLRPQFASPAGYLFQDIKYEVACESSSSTAVSLWSSPTVQEHPDSYNRIGQNVFPHHIATSAEVTQVYQRRYPHYQMNSHNTGISATEEGSVMDHGPCQKYSMVRVLLMHWVWDGNLPGCTNEVHDLEYMFREKFGFHTQIYGITGEDAAAETISWLAGFSAASRSDELLIIYYAGHAIQNPFQLDSPPGCSNTIPWSPIQSILESSKSDVLLLMDCCYAMASLEIPCRGAKMLIGACGTDQRAAIPGEFSFTSRLLNALKILSNNFQHGVSATALQIYVASMMAQAPNPWFEQASQMKLFAGSGDIWLERIVTSLGIP